MRGKRVGLRMDDTSGKFALVVLRAKQVRVHHKRTKHEYVFRISDNRIEVADASCIQIMRHPSIQEIFVKRPKQPRNGSSRSVPGFPRMSSTTSPGPVGWQRNRDLCRSAGESTSDKLPMACAALAVWQIEHTWELFHASRNSG